MRRTLFFIPHEVASIPVFGIGWLLGFIVLAAAIVSIVMVRNRQNVAEYWRWNWFVWLFAAGIVTFVLPQVELLSKTGDPVGLAVRGYGVMLMLGVIASAALAFYRAPRYGVNQEIMVGIAPWLIVGGLLGARLFYIIEYREQFFGDDLFSTLRNMLDVTGGGLVVYGAFIGGFLAGVAYVLRHGLPFLTTGDIIVPCLFVGLGLGRLGCLMNGCCYGNACEDGWAALRFPNSSPVFQNQLASGELLGIELSDDGRRVISVQSGSMADESGVNVGARVDRFAPARSVEEIDENQPVEDAPLGVLAIIDGVERYWPASQFPPTANPVRASQVISSVGGFLLCLGLCLFSRYASRPGLVMFVGFASYAVLRFGMEILRNDEPGQFGTELTIAQWVSIVVFTLSIGALVWLKLQRATPDPANTASAQHA